MYPDIVDTPRGYTPGTTLCHALRTEHYIGIAELIRNVIGPATWECRVWDRNSAEVVAETTLYTELGAKQWLDALCRKEARNDS